MTHSQQQDRSRAAAGFFGGSGCRCLHTAPHAIGSRPSAVAALFVVLVLAVPPAVASAAAGQEPNPKVAKLSKLLAGNWTCSETVSQPDGTKVVQRGTFTIRLGLGGHWLVGTLTWAPRPGSAGRTMVDYRTWDETKNAWKSYAFDDSGGFSESATLRADEKTMLWAGVDVTGGRSYWWRSTEAVASPKRMTFSVEGSADGKTYAAVAHGECTR